jgi:hypothetical protein
MSSSYLGPAPPALKSSEDRRKASAPAEEPHVFTAHGHALRTVLVGTARAKPFALSRFGAAGFATAERDTADSEASAMGATSACSPARPHSRDHACRRRRSAYPVHAPKHAPSKGACPLLTLLTFLPARRAARRLVRARRASAINRPASSAIRRAARSHLVAALPSMPVPGAPQKTRF